MNTNNKTAFIVLLMASLGWLQASSQWTQSGTGGTGKITTLNNVGIGTANPAVQLHVVGEGVISESGSAEGGRFSIRNPSKTGVATNNWTLYNMTAPYVAGVHFWRYSGTAPVVSQGAAMIIADNGNVGIGTGSTTSPAGQLHVVGDGIISQFNSAEGGRISIRNTTKAGSDVTNWTIYNMTAPYSKGLHFWRYSSTGANLGDAVVFNDDGSVKIGAVTTPNVAGYKLYVDQGILTEKVKIAVAGSVQWADHVFYKNYQLLPLEKVEEFIRQNKHLPNVPSAEEMVKEGNDLGKTDAKLLEKIEELTLYMIELKKENTEMKNIMKKHLKKSGCHEKE